ncbi:periplasmic heavy metal sensor [Frigidibacter sp. MR17.14]|uniref:periplasmic heavy metal sensor n=1 Tax=Frigidibacter sp. MR17.14 TaxID=3126509 RepID=UPI003012AFBD
MKTPSAVAPRWLKPAFFVSVALNLGLAGLIAGAALSERHRGPPPDLGFGPYGEALSPEDRRGLRSAFREQAGSMRDMRAQMRGDFDRLLVLLRQDPYDAEAAAQLILAQQHRVDGAFDLGHKLLIERLGRMTAAERQAFADRLQSVLRPPPHDRRDGDED